MINFMQNKINVGSFDPNLWALHTNLLNILLKNLYFALPEAKDLAHGVLVEFPGGNVITKHLLPNVKTLYLNQIIIPEKTITTR